jgi:hypothetical protein
MRLSPATRLRDRQTVWVAYRNDGSAFNAITDPVGHPATIWAAQFAEAHADEVAPCPISGWVYA